MIIIIVIIFLTLFTLLLKKRPKSDEQATSLKEFQSDDNVQFTIYRPRAIEPERWYKLLVISHLSELPLDAPVDATEPKAEVEKIAREVLDQDVQAYRDITAESKGVVPREGILTFIPDFEGITFIPDNPPSFLWMGKTHPIEFSMRAAQVLEGKTVKGCMRVYWGIVLLAEINLNIEVNTAKAKQYQNTPLEPTIASRYRKIFASYSHQDSPIVEQFERFADTQGDEYLRDIRDIRAGEVWNKRLEELIKQADVFQLFWSSKSMRSKFVRQEWEYALSLNRSDFIRPTYWEEPMPVDPVEKLPPEVLLALQFKKFWFSQEAFAQIIKSVPEDSKENEHVDVIPNHSVPGFKTIIVILCVSMIGMFVWYAPSRKSYNPASSQGPSISHSSDTPRTSPGPLKVSANLHEVKDNIVRYRLSFSNFTDVPLKNIQAHMEFPEGVRILKHEASIGITEYIDAEYLVWSIDELMPTNSIRVQGFLDVQLHLPKKSDKSANLITSYLRVYYEGIDGKRYYDIYNMDSAWRLRPLMR
jgi:hypothetical protein